jgi:pyruvate dehydrogenase E2 component (dihydrolipoamide acetyltransferase)
MDDADVDAWSEATDITIRLVGAILAGCRAEPVLNAWFDSYSTARRVLENIDIAIAVDTQEGLFTPVLRDVASRDDDDLRDGLEKLKEDVISRKVPGSEMRDYTITLSNFGMIAGRYSTPVIVPPTVAILGAGRIDRRPVVVDDNVVAHRVLPISLTFDHRAVTGGEAGRFLAAVIESLES